MAFWDIDLTTEDGAIGAAELGGYACFVAAVLGAIGIAMITGLSFRSAPETAIGTLAVGAAEIIVFVVAGFRLRAGRGMIWGSVAALLLVIEIVMKLVTLTGLGGVVINVILLVGILNGVRGARVLKGGWTSPDAAAEYRD